MKLEPDPYRFDRWFARFAVAACVIALGALFYLGFPTPRQFTAFLPGWLTDISASKEQP